MTTLDLKPSHKPVQEYYAELSKLSDLRLEAEGAVGPAFANLLRSCGRQFKLTLGEQFPIKRKNGRLIGKVIFVSVETVKAVKGLPKLE